MRHRKLTFKLGRTSEHRKALLANQVASLIHHGQIKTTLEKAKGTRRLAEKMVTLAKKGGLHRRRLVISRIFDVPVAKREAPMKGFMTAVEKLFSEIAPRYAERNGGYTRIIKLGPRKGDSAEMCLLQWVEEGAVQPKPKKKRKKTEAEKKPEKKDDKPGTSDAPAPEEKKEAPAPA